MLWIVFIIINMCMFESLIGIVEEIKDGIYINLEFE